MLTRIICFLVRKKLDVRKNQLFRFDNQKSAVDLYFINSKGIYKMTPSNCTPSHVSLYWLLNKSCKIIKTKGEVT